MARSNKQRPVGWLVLLAFLFSTLAPSLAMGLGGPDVSRTVWAQLCSADGPELVAIQVDDPDSDASYVTADQQGHCLLCFQPTTSPEYISATPVAGMGFVQRIVVAPITPPATGPSWSPALARAPPAVS